MTARPWRAEKDGVLLACRLSPRAARDGVEGFGDDGQGRPLLVLRLTAPPVDGKANAALVAYLAKALGLRRSDVAIRSGAAARHKILFLRGDPADLSARLEALAAGGPRRS